MMRFYWLLTISLLALSALLAGCGSTATNGTPVPPTVTTARTISPTRSPIVMKTPTSGVREGSVTIRVGVPAYRASDEIMVTLDNQSSQSISFPDHLTNCSVVLLQQQVGLDWQAINLCRLGTVTRVHLLPAGQHLIVGLLPPQRGWRPGLYHVDLQYGTTNHEGLPITISSAEFSVG